MNCPVCHKELPLKFVYAAELKKYECPSCSSSIITTKKSMSKIKLGMGTFSFVTATPLGAYCCYLWLGTAQPLFSMYFLFFGTAGILLIVSLYSKSHIKFQPSWLAL